MKPEHITERIKDASMEDARLAVRLMHDETTIEKHKEKFPKTFAWMDQCYIRPSVFEVDVIMQALSELLGFHGVEAINTSEWIDSRNGNIRATYLNSGHTYAATIIWDNRDKRWILTTMGDYVDSIEGEEIEDGVVEVY